MWFQYSNQELKKWTIIMTIYLFIENIFFTRNAVRIQTHVYMFPLFIYDYGDICLGFVE